jgi:hypothetical protein
MEIAAILTCAQANLIWGRVVSRNIPQFVKEEIRRELVIVSSPGCKISK